MINELLLMIGAVTLYWPVCNAPLMFDDRVMIEEDEDILGGQWRRYLYGRISLRQLTRLTFAITVAWAGGFRSGSKAHAKAIRWMHTTNSVIHGLSCIAIYHILEAVIRIEWPTSQATAMAGVTALAIVFHPIAFSAVANISGRSSSLSGLFYFCSLWAAVTGQMTVAWALVPLALLSKEDAIVLPFVIAATSSIMGYGHGQWIIFLVVIPLLMWLRWDNVVSSFKSNGSQDMEREGYRSLLKPAAMFMTVAVTLAKDLPCWMVGAKIHIDPDPDRIEVIDQRIGRALVVAVSAACLFIISGDMAIRLALLWTIVTPMAIYAFIPVADPIMMNRAYGILPGIALCLGGLCAWLWDFTMMWWLITLPMFWILLGVTHKSVKHWSDPESLWRQAIIESPNKERPRMAIGEVLVTQKNFEAASIEYRQLMKQYPRLLAARLGLGAIAHDVGMYQRAKQIFQEIIMEQPLCAIAWRNLGLIQHHEGNLIEAENYYRKSMDCPGGDTAINHYSLGGVLYLRQRFEMALVEFQEACRLRPDQPWYDYNLAATLIALRRYEDGFKVIMRLPPECIDQLKKYPLPPEIETMIGKSNWKP